MKSSLLKIFLLHALFICILPKVFAQEDTTIVPDSASVSVAEDSNQAGELPGYSVKSQENYTIARDSILAWKRSPGFGYMAYIDSLLKSRKNLLKADTISIGRRSISNQEGESSSSGISIGFMNSRPVRFFFLALALFFIIVVLYRFFLAGQSFNKGKKRMSTELLPDEMLELNDYDAYNSLIEDAESKNELNLATRFLYLQTLKKLADAELIHFTPDKTDDKYVVELAGRSFGSDFSDLTTYYEYIWYGRFAIPADYYAKLKEKFKAFINKI
jgi:Domain of unknown function (DUF4129)